jgi:hypothetical protein
MPTKSDSPWPSAHAAIALARGMGAAEISADEVIAHLANVGIRASKTALASAHRADLIARPRIGRLGRGKGTISYYPVETVGQYACYQAALRVHRNKGDAGWRLWCLGANVPEIYWRPRLERQARQVDFFRSLARSIADRQDGSDRESDYAASRLDRLGRKLFVIAVEHSMMRRVRKDLGRERLRQVIGHFTAILAGRFRDFSSQPEQDDADRIRENKLMDVVFAMGSARTDHLPGYDPWLSGDVAPALAKLSCGIGRRSAIQTLAMSSQGEIAIARAELGEVLSVAAILAEAARMTYGSNAFGLRRVREFVGSLTPDMEATLLIFWLMVRWEFKDDARRFVQDFRSAAEAEIKPIQTAPDAPPPKLRRKSNAYPVS